MHIQSKIVSLCKCINCDTIKVFKEFMQRMSYLPLFTQSWRLEVLEQMAVKEETLVVVVVKVMVAVVRPTRKRNWGSLRPMKPG